MVLVAAIDDSDQTEAVLSEANRLADDLDTSVHAVHVVSRADLSSIAETAVEGQELVENAEVQDIGRDIVAERTDAATAESIQTTVRVGDPATQVVEYASSVDARYVVVGGRNRSPTGKALFGSVTQQVLFESPVPVLSVAVE
ncbi:universal stress protein [Haloarcula salina]|uniref:Universal stress protein n=1 Tax=Haloarcula salina TaxID=1429914 RepID=A0AA41G396_9EURY|nr:universal stress protein [Haloarcula salina]MBV0903527.1 universal stress protein [Haloarcula salina]